MLGWPFYWKAQKIMTTLSDLSEQLLNAAHKAGASQADALAIKGTSMEISVRAGALENADRSEGTDIGLRVIVGQKQACVSSSDTSTAAITQMAERAVAMASVAPDDEHVIQADPSQFAQNWDLDAFDMIDPTPAPSADDLQQTALAVEAATLAVNGVTQTQSAAAGFGASELFLATSQGFRGGYRRSSHSIYSVAIAGQGSDMQRDADGDSRVYRDDLRNIADIGTTAGQRAVALMGARKPPTGSYPVMFDERIAASLVGHVLAAVNGAVISRGGSWLRDKLGQCILPGTLSITERSHRPRSGSSRPFDGEGLPTRSRAIVQNGILQGWTLDLTHAHKLGMAPTGSAVRGTSAPPSPGTSNIELTQGDKSQADLLRDMGTGVLITGLIGATINPNTGDYSRGASGFWVENGEIQHPVNEFTIAGNLADMIRSMIPANDARAYKATVVPSLLVSGLTIAGA